MPLRTINLTPDPRMLRMLGQIELKGWQCIAELIDNAIDSVVRIGDDKKGKEISVRIPSMSQIRQNSPLVIQDNGQGMDDDQLENCLRAGYTSHVAENSLGLFGMGFNIATARLGDVVEVWTSTENMQHDIGVRIDLMEMQRTGSFVRELHQRAKQFSPSGTSISISKYHPRAENLLNAKAIQNNIDRAYSESLIEKYLVRLSINGKEVQPFKFCTWSSRRSVKYKGDEIPAFIDIYKEFENRLFCTRCFRWLEDAHHIQTDVSCPNCDQADRVVKKKVKIEGWVGIQRFNHKDHYGINIVRNGRIIRRLDKSLFTWNDREDKNNGASIFEYPIDTTAQGGRIVGEIRADFITPHYTKDSFEETDIIWLDAVENVRGKEPFQPELAKRLGFGKNKSPLGRLFNGYRRSSPPGKRWLIPGNSKGSALHQQARDWATLFHQGDRDYQDDQKWWDAVEAAELQEDETQAADPTDLPGTDSKSGTAHDVPEEDLYPGRKRHLDTKLYDLENLINERPIRVNIMEYWPEKKLDSPIIFEPTTASCFDVYINQHHNLFRDFADGWEDLVLMEVASRFFGKIDDPSQWPLTKIYYNLKLKYASESMLNVDALVTNAKSLMKDIQNLLSSGVRGLTLKQGPILNDEELKSLKKNHLELERRNLKDPSEVLKTTMFLKYMDLKYIFKFINQYPELIFDNHFFELAYMELDEELRQTQLQEYQGYFNDVKWFIYELPEFSEDLISAKKNNIIRSKLSLEILNDKRAALQ